MPIIVGRSHIIGDIAFEATRLEALAADLHRIGRGDLPGEDELAAAPLLDPWTFDTWAIRCLAGGVHGHPKLHGPLAKTTEIWVWAPDFGWARTLSRFYRLGRQIGAEYVS